MFPEISTCRCLPQTLCVYEAYMIRYIILVLTSSYILSAEASDNKYIDFFDSTASKLVKEYRLPVRSDMKYAWKAIGGYTYKTKDSSGEYKAPYWTSGFFNGDKQLDYAYILISHKNNKKQLIAFISSSNGYIAKKLGDSHNTEMGVATQDSGVLDTASGKGYWEPSADDPPKVNIVNHAVSYFMFESASSVFIWNDKNKSFKRHWISD